MTVSIRPVQNPRDLKRFILFPHALYKDDPYWVPPLISDEKKLLTPGKHPFHEHAEVRLFLAEKNGETVGRISGHVNYRHNKFHDDKVGFFGFFDCVEDQESADALFKAAGDFVAEKGMDTLRGPMNFSTNETCGLLVNAFDEAPYIMMPYNYDYYEKLIEKAGFEKARDLLCYHLDEEIFDFKRIGKIARRIEKKSQVTLRQAQLNRLDEEIQIIREIYNSAWEKNWGFVPMTDAEFAHIAKDLKPIVDPRLLYIAEHEGKPVGFILCLPDFNQVLKKMNGRLFPFGLLKALWYKRKINRIRIITMGVIEEFRRMGLDILFYNKIAQVSPATGRPSGEIGWVLEDNKMMNRAAQAMGSKVTKRYRIFDAQIK